jgi:hypothetical protein
MPTNKLNRKKWQCRLLIYSGRPDPQWPITESAVEEWLKICHNAPLAHDMVPEAAALGYRGVIFHRGNDYYYIFDGHIRYMEKELSILKQDAGRQLEKKILETAPTDIQKIAAQGFNDKT